MQRVLGVVVDRVVEDCYVFVVRDWNGEGVVVGLSHDGMQGDGEGWGDALRECRG